jgi:hypothetical protein
VAPNLVVRDIERAAREVSVRRIRYQVASSLDGYIAGPKAEADWIIIVLFHRMSAWRGRVPYP